MLNPAKRSEPKRNYLSKTDLAGLAAAAILYIFIIDSIYAIFRETFKIGSPWQLKESLVVHFFIFLFWLGLFLIAKLHFGKPKLYMILAMTIACVIFLAAFTFLAGEIRAWSGRTIVGWPTYQMVKGAFVFFAPLFVIPTIFLIGLVYAVDAREHHRLLAQSRELAQQATMMALRFQLNPHFMHNTLGSISTLILDGQNDRADVMVTRLSKFLRANMLSSATDDATAANEFSVISDYLGIEVVRFESQLRVRIDLPTELESALLPSFLLQPLVENSIKHGMASFPAVTDITVFAGRQEDDLVLTIINTCTAPTLKHAGSGIGVSNVRERLISRFGDRFSFGAGPIDPNGFEVVIKIPLLLARSS